MNTSQHIGGNIVGRAIAFGLQTALAAADWVTKHGHPGLAWPVILLIVAATGFGIAASLAAVISFGFGFNCHWVLFGVAGAVSCIVGFGYMFFKVAGH